MPVAQRAEVEDAFAEVFEDWLGGGEGGLVARAHEIEHAVAGMGGRAADGGVEIGGACGGDFFAKRFGRSRQRGAEIDNNLACAKARDHAIRAAHPAFDVVRGPHA